MDVLRARRLILAAAAVGLVLRLGFGFLYWTGKPLTHDEREYLALAESLSDGRGLRYPPGHVWRLLLGPSRPSSRGEMTAARRYLPRARTLPREG